MDCLKKLFETVFDELRLFETKKEIYTRQEVLNALSYIKVYGETANFRGGRPPIPVLIPILKETETSQALIRVGYNTFNYKLYNSFSNYDPNASIEWGAERRTEKTDYVQTKYILSSNAFIRPNGDLGYIKTLGIEGISELQQIKAHIDELYNEFKALTQNQP